MSYTLDIKLEEPLESAIDAILGELEEAIENIHKYRPTRIVHREEVDVHELLAKSHEVAVIWEVEDVLEVRPDLSADQAWEVLEAARQDHDATIGINWTTLEATADDLYPETDSKQEA